jgi:hypothetical protein
MPLSETYGNDENLFPAQNRCGNDLLNTFANRLTQLLVAAAVFHKDHRGRAIEEVRELRIGRVGEQ